MIVHILVTPGYFVGFVKGNGARKWHPVTGRCKTSEAALIRAARKFAKNDKRIRILFCPGGDSYYEPHVCMEVKRV